MHQRRRSRQDGKLNPADIEDWSRKGDDSVSIQQLGRRASMRTDRQGKILPLGPVTMTRTLAKKRLLSFQHEQLLIPKHEHLQEKIAGDVTDLREL